jgi:diaminopimelate epimerase
VRGDVEGELWVEVDLGEPAPGPEWVTPAAAATTRTAVRAAGTVDLGNPHLVLVVDDPDRVPLEDVGPVLESAFPQGVNVHAVVPVDTGRLRMRVWERGAGITEACGSGAAAAVVTAHALGEVGKRVRVEMPGGEATVELVDGRVLLTGPTEFVGEVVVP